MVNESSLTYLFLFSLVPIPASLLTELRTIAVDFYFGIHQSVKLDFYNGTQHVIVLAFCISTQLHITVDFDTQKCTANTHTCILPCGPYPCLVACRIVYYILIIL